MSGAGVFVRAAVLAGACLVACGPREVTVAQESPPPSPEAGVQTCTKSLDCPADAYCDKATCSSPTGVCTLRPPACDDVELWECGCDGVLYWNSCLRRRDGVESATAGFCGTHFADCGGPHGAKCPVADAICGRAHPDPRACDAPGLCFVLPDTCPATTGMSDWVACGGPPGPCTDLCSALRTERPYVRAPDRCP